MAEQQQRQGQLLQPQQQQLQQPPGLQGVAADALTLLEQELNSQQPSVSNASLVLGILQERLFSGDKEGQPLAAAVAQLAGKFEEQLVAPAAAKLGPKCKLTQVRLQWHPYTYAFTSAARPINRALQDCGLHLVGVGMNLLVAACCMSHLK
jgi:hypothetical protein